MTCIFCQIARGEAPATIVHQDRYVVAFRDVAPQARVHIVIATAYHADSLNEAPSLSGAALGELLRTAAILAIAEGLAVSGYRVVINTGQDAGQTVPHLHLHLLGGEPLP